jgi:hypothetical protein
MCAANNIAIAPNRNEGTLQFLFGWEIDGNRKGCDDEYA